ncbi:MAG TPA: phosphatidate cytidylyltransferase [Rubricoccaceae bacterium]|jgi:dolichol kinase
MSDAAPAIPYAAEVRRKALHLGALVLPAGMLILGRPTAALILVPLAVLAVALDWARVRSAGARRVLHAVFSSLMRPEEVPPLGGPVVLNGATWMCVASALVAVLFPPGIAAAAMAMLMVGDGAAAVVGRRWGRTKWPGGLKSVEGTAAYAATAFAVGLAVVAWPGSGLTLGPCAAGAVAGALVEAAPIPLNDNVRVPVLSGLAMLAMLAL